MVTYSLHGDRRLLHKDYLRDRALEIRGEGAPSKSTESARQLGFLE